MDRGWRVVTRGPGLYLTTAWCVQRIPDLQQGSQRSSHEGEPVQGAQEGELIICLKKEHALQQGGVTRHFPEKLNENRGYFFTKITWYIDYLVNGNIVSTG